MKIKIIDLLNKWANGEKLPERICYEGTIYELVDNNIYDWYKSAEYNDESNFLDNVIATRAFLNNYVEIIEEPTIEKLEDRIERAVEFLETQYNTYPNGEMWRDALKNILQEKNADDVYKPFIEDNKKLEKIDFTTLNTQKAKNRAMKDAINKIIDEINSTKGDKICREKLQ